MRKPSVMMVKEIVAEVSNWRRETMEHYMHHVSPTSYRPSREESWCRSGLEKLSGDACNFFTEKTGVPLPYNLYYFGPAIGFSGSARRIVEQRDEMVEAYARFSGWMKTAVKLPELIQIIKRTQSTRGFNSPRTTIDMWKFIERHPSPHRAARFYRRLHKRANKILSGYGLKVSWDALAQTLERGPRRIGKAAMFAAAKTVEQFAGGNKRRKGISLNSLWHAEDGRKMNGRDFLVKVRGWRDALAAPEGIRNWAEEKVKTGEYSCFTEALADAPSKLILDKTDSVILYVDPTTEIFIHGIKVVLGWGNYKMFLISDGTGRNYHQAYYYSPAPKVAVREALKAWHQQKQLERVHEKMLSRLRPADRTILIYREDSYRAGNCQAGTAAFAERSGFNGRPFVPAEWLFPFVENTAVRRVLNQVANQL